MALTQSGVAKLRNAVVLLRETSGFNYLPIIVPHEVAGRDAINEMMRGCAADPQTWHELAWPATDDGADSQALAAQRVALLEALDHFAHGASRAQTLILDASPMARSALALASIAYLNLRREPLRTRAHRLILVWPQNLAEALRSGAPDLWSQRALAPVLAHEDVVIAPSSQETVQQAGELRPSNPPGRVNPVVRAQLERWFATHNLAAADLSLSDALNLAQELNNRRDDLELQTLARAIREESKPDSPEMAHTLFWESLALGRAGLRVEAVSPGRKSVDLFRRLAALNPAAYEPDLARSLNNLANFQSEAGDRAGSLAMARAAVEIYQRLAQANPSAYEPNLAGSLNNLARAQSETGDRASALAAARAAVAIYQRLAQANLAAYEPDLAGSLSNLANLQSESGDRAGALETARAAVEIRQRLAQANPVAYEPDLAMSLNNLAGFQSESCDRAGALETARAAVEIRRRLALASPVAYEPDLARSLCVLAMRLGENGESAEARSTAQAAVELLQPWAERMPDAFGPLFGIAQGLYDGLRNAG